ncbi:MAG: hypothetical protein IPM51_11115 [Sphingobacteriaceae bacterium]|nr:hypothetical protein [Sphingobacteriaceae bacterium]
MKTGKYILAFVIGFAFAIKAQEPLTIKVRKEQRLAKAYFDNTELKLSAIDKFGNVSANRITSFKFWIKGNRNPINGFDNNLGPEISKELNKLKKSTKIYFTDIYVLDDEGHPLKLPDLYEIWFPNCVNCDVVKKKKRH